MIYLNSKLQIQIRLGSKINGLESVGLKLAKICSGAFGIPTISMPHLDCH